MKCKMKTNPEQLRTMLVIGLVLLACGIGGAWLIEGDNPTAMRLAGFCAGMGGAFTAMGGGFLLWRRVIGEQRAQESDRAMNDERGQLIAYKTSGVLALTAVIVICAQLIIAMVRGDSFYMLLGTAGCFIIAIASGVARAVYSKKL